MGLSEQCLNGGTQLIIVIMLQSDNWNKTKMIIFFLLLRWKLWKCICLSDYIPCE